MRKLILIASSAAVLAGCVTRANLVADDGNRYEMQVNPATKGLSTTIEAIPFSGKYVTGSAVGVSQTFGAKPSFGTVAMGGNSGQALLTATNGDYLECAFSYSGLTVLGRCKSKFGKEYLLTTE